MGCWQQWLHPFNGLLLLVPPFAYRARRNPRTGSQLLGAPVCKLPDRRRLLKNSCLLLSFP